MRDEQDLSPERFCAETGRAAVRDEHGRIDASEFYVDFLAWRKDNQVSHDPERKRAFLLQQSGVARDDGPTQFHQLAAPRTDNERRMRALFVGMSETAGNGQHQKHRLLAVVASEGATNNGCGKTLLASIAVRAVCERGHSGRIIDAAHWCDLLAQRVWNGDDGKREFMDDWQRPSLLAIDELDKAPNNEARRDLLAMVRLRQADPTKATALLTNWTRAELDASCGASVSDRVSDCVACDWPSYRQKPTPGRGRPVERSLLQPAP